MVRMPWLKMRLALALMALPGTAVAVSACGPAQTAEPDQPKPVIENKIDPDEPLPEPELPALTADQWCGSPDDAVQRGGYRDQGDACPAYTYADGYDWNRDDANGQLRSDATGGTVCCYSRDPYGGQVYEGRPLVVDGRVLTAAAAPTPAWAPNELIDGSVADGLDASVRDEIARRWIDNGLIEHASVASFARAVIELMAVGAPPSLISAAQRAASDEIRHAQMCFAIASGYIGAQVGPGPLTAAAPRQLDLAQLAVTTFVEGCVSESVGALEAERLGQQATHPSIRRILREIADDEARHAELAWSTVGWAVRTGGRPVVDAVVDAARGYDLGVDAPSTPFDGVLGAHGLMAAEARAAHLRRVYRELIVPLVDDLVANWVPASPSELADRVQPDPGGGRDHA